MDNILNSIDKYSLDLLKQCMLSNSASCFYTHLYNENNQNRLKNTLYLCVNNICIKQNINVINMYLMIPMRLVSGESLRM